MAMSINKEFIGRTRQVIRLGGKLEKVKVTVINVYYMCLMKLSKNKLNKC
jgi:mitochondrial fission protein ELM1